MWHLLPRGVNLAAKRRQSSVGEYIITLICSPEWKAHEMYLEIHSFYSRDTLESTYGTVNNQADELLYDDSERYVARTSNPLSIDHTFVETHKRNSHVMHSCCALHHYWAPPSSTCTVQSKTPSRSFPIGNDARRSRRAGYSSQRYIGHFIEHSVVILKADPNRLEVEKRKGEREKKIFGVAK